MLRALPLSGGRARSMWDRSGPDGTPATGDQHVQTEHDDRAEDRPDDARGLQESAVGVAAEQQEAQEAADERADDAEHDREQDAHALLARDERASDEAGDESDDDQTENCPEHDSSSFSGRLPGVCG